MPRGNQSNLKSNTDRTPEEMKALTQKAGIASGEARRRKKMLKDCLEALLEKETIRDEETGDMITGAEALAVKIFQRAMKGDVKAFEVLRDTAGQKPIERVEVSMPKAKMADEIEAALQEIQGGGVDGTGANSGPDAAD